MKILYIARHGKAEPSLFKLDFERLLTDVGVERTQQIARYLKTNESVPELIITSTASRSLSTALVFADELGINENKVYQELDLFDCTADDMIDIVSENEYNTDSLMIVGHNPQLTDLANKFIEDKIDNIPTSGVVVVIFHTDQWNNIMQVKSELLFKVWPGML